VNHLDIKIQPTEKSFAENLISFLRASVVSVSVLSISKIVFILLLLALLPQVAAAKEPYQKFLRALQESGYADVALEYINRIEKDPDLPPELLLTLDLERSNSLRKAAETAYDVRQAEQMLVDAQKYLDKFLKEHPDHPAAASSILFWGDSLVELGQRSVGLAHKATEPTIKAKYLAEAREYFKQAGERFEEASKRFLARFEQLPPDDPKKARRPPAKGPAPMTEREEMEAGVVQAQFKACQAKYYLALTYDDPKSSERPALLKEAAKGFNDIYQQYRNDQTNERCLVAHLWEGQTLVELGDDATAMEIFDEVLIRDSAASDPALAPIYAQASFLRFGLMRKQGKLDDFINEGTEWVESHKSWTNLSNFNGVVLELAKAYRERAEKEPREAQRKTLQKAAVLLAEFSKAESPYKQDILLLRRDILKQLGTENVGPGELLALGDMAIREGKIDDAEKLFEQAKQKALDAKDQKSADEAQKGTIRVALLKAQTLFDKRNYADSLKVAMDLSKGDAADPVTIAAAELALNSALYAGAASENKDNAYAELDKVADFVKNKWPGRPIADVARMILAQSLLQKNDTSGALALYRQVQPESPRYPEALYNMGRIHWYLYLQEKQKGDNGDTRKMADESAKTKESLQKSLELLQKMLASGGDDNASAEETRCRALLDDLHLLQGEMLLEAKEYRQATAILDPLVEKLQTSKSSESPLRGFAAAIYAHLGLEEVDKAADQAIALVVLVPDDAKANARLTNIARLINEKLKAAEATVTEAKDGDPQTLETATAKRDALKARLRSLVEPLGKRKELPLSDLLFLGSACFNLDLADEGGQIYEDLLQRAKDDPAFAKKSEKALIFAQSKLIGVKRSQGKLKEALDQADDLIKKNPRSLEPKLTKADILGDMSAKDAKKLDEAIALWTDCRLMLSRENPKRSEYYEIIYKIADGLYQQYDKSKDRAKLEPAEQLLRSTLVQYANLSGPDTVARYNALLKKIQDAKAKK
jgi:TolA-binding protein